MQHSWCIQVAFAGIIIVSKTKFWLILNYYNCCIFSLSCVRDS